MTTSQVFLLVFLWIGNQWVPGWKVDGFYPMEMETIEDCLSSADFVSKQPQRRVFLENGDMAVADRFQGRCMVVYPWGGR